MLDLVVPLVDLEDLDSKVQLDSLEEPDLGVISFVITFYLWLGLYDQIPHSMKILIEYY